jgi:hypothetical protein
MFQVYEMIFDILTLNEIITIVIQIKAPIIWNGYMKKIKLETGGSHI